MQQPRRIECAICMDIYTDPYILSCNHSFCKKCIDDLAGVRTVQCPLCNAYSYRNVVNPNYALKDAMQEITRESHREQTSHSNEVPLTNDSKVHKLCSVCLERRVEFRCIDCSDWLCVECRNGHTRIKATKHHVFEKLSQCNNKMEKEISEQTNQIRHKISQYTDNCNKFEEEICSVKQIQTAAVTNLSYLRDKIIKEIQTRFSRHEKEIKLLCEQQVEKLMKYAEKNGKPIESLKKRLQEINTEIQSHKNELAISGENILTDVKKLTDSHVPRNYRITPFSLEVVLSSAWKPMEILTLKHNSSQVQCDEPRPTRTALFSLAHKQWKHKKSVELPTAPSSLRLIDDQLWQCRREGISVFTLDLEPVRDIPSRDMGSIYDVASTGPEEVVVAADEGLYSHNREGNFTNRIAEGWFTSVCLHKDLLYAALFYSNTVRVNRRSGSTWTESSRFSVERGGATLSVNSAGVYMCAEWEYKFCHYSHSGELFSSTGSGGSGIDEMDRPCLCCVDSTGTALIADWYNNRLKLLSRGGTWSVIDLQPRVEKPQAALFCNDRLYVNSSETKSLKMYI